MHKQGNSIFLEELKSRRDFELFYEFSMWDYSESKNELDSIKVEIERRRGKKSLLKFACSALLINFSLLLIEAVYRDRWEYFEDDSKQIWMRLVVGFVVNVSLFALSGFVISRMNEMIWRLVVGTIALIFILPTVIKTNRDFKNYSK